MPRPPAAAAGAGRPCAVSAARRAAEPGPRLLSDGAPGPGRAAALPGGDPSALGAPRGAGWGALGWGFPGGTSLVGKLMGFHDSVGFHMGFDEIYNGRTMEEPCC